MPGRLAPVTLGYRPALDGLRAIAVLVVLVYHGGGIRGGFLGVDVFFTLSGFLITTLLCEEHARTGTIAIGRFYGRRACRLLPALGAFLLVWGGGSLATTSLPFWPIILGDLLGVLFYVANWLIIYGRPAGPFGHTWSLSIEEQFYLGWPVILLLLLRWVQSPRWIVAWLVTAAAGSLVWRLTLALADAPFNRMYLGTDTHADGLVLGAALAVWLCRLGGGGAPSSWRRAGVACSVVGLPVLLVAAPLVPGYARGVTALAALATSGVILDIVAGGSRVTRWLACPWLVRIGRISYGVYLWHYPIFLQLGVLRRPGEAVTPFGYSALAWGLTFAAALVSYVLIERPFLAYKARLSAMPPPTKRETLANDPAEPRVGSVSA